MGSLVLLRVFFASLTLITRIKDLKGSLIIQLPTAPLSYLLRAPTRGVMSGTMGGGMHLPFCLVALRCWWPTGVENI